MNKKNSSEFYNGIDEIFGKIGEMQKSITSKKIAEMEKSLDKLEEELTDIIKTHSDIFTEN